MMAHTQEVLNMTQKELSRWLRAVVIVGWCGCALMAAWVMPQLAEDVAWEFPELAFLKWPCLVFFWLALAPVVAALAYAYRIFTEIGRDNSFCRENALRLRIISRLALADTVWCMAAMIALLILNVLHPGVFLLMLAVIVFGAAVAVAAAALSHLTLKAASLQDENDLTI